MSNLKPIYTTLFVSGTVLSTSFLLSQEYASASACPAQIDTALCDSKPGQKAANRAAGIVRLAGLSRTSYGHQNTQAGSLLDFPPLVSGTQRTRSYQGGKSAETALPGLVATPFAVRKLKRRAQRLQAAEVRKRISDRITPIILAEREASKNKHRARILAARKHASILRRFSTRAAQRMNMAAGTHRHAPGRRVVQGDALRANALCQTDALSPANFPSLNGFAAKSLARAAASSKALARPKQAAPRMRLASLKFDHLPIGLHGAGPIPETLTKTEDEDSENREDVIDWVSSALLAKTSPLLTPVSIRELKLRKAGRRIITKQATLGETIVDEALQSPKAPEIVIKPAIRKLRPVTKRRTAPRNWMQVRSASTKCFPRKLKKLLRRISTHYGKPVIVISGYRSPKHNRRVGGARRSQHMRCTAADFRVAGVSKYALAKYAAAASSVFSGNISSTLGETIVDEALQSPKAPEIVIKPAIRKLRPVTKRRTAPRNWMQVRSASTKCFPRKLKKLLRRISTHYGKPVIVISGYRSPKHNRRVGGARRSQHMRCTAADFRVAGVSKYALAKYAKSLPGRGGVGTYCRSGFIHVDVGPRRTWHWSCKRRGKRRVVKRRNYRKKYTSRRKAKRRVSQHRRSNTRG